MALLPVASTHARAAQALAAVVLRSTSRDDMAVLRGRACTQNPVYAHAEPTIFGTPVQVRALPVSRPAPHVRGARDPIKDV